MRITSLAVLAALAAGTHLYLGGSTSLFTQRAEAATTKEATVAPLKIGAAAPDFIANDVDGKPHSLKDYKGKIVVLEWMNPDCPFVKKHYLTHNMTKLQEYYTGKGVIWLSVNSSADGKEGHLTAQSGKDFEKDAGAHPTALLLDADGKLGHAYGAKTTPHMFIVDKDGKLAYQGAIDDTPTPDMNDVEDAKNYVKSALDAMLAGKKVETTSTASYGCSVKY